MDVRLKVAKVIRLYVIVVGLSGKCVLLRLYQIILLFSIDFSDHVLSTLLLCSKRFMYFATWKMLCVFCGLGSFVYSAPLVGKLFLQFIASCFIS